MRVDVVYGSALWHAPTKVNCHFVAERLAQEVPVVFVESVGSRLPRAHEWRRLGPRLLRSLRPLKRVGDKLWVMSPLPLPAYGSKFVKGNSAWVGWQIWAMLALRRWRPQVSWIFHPMGLGVARLSGAKRRVYYCIDDYAANPGVDAEAVEHLENDLAMLADVTLVTGEPLAKRLRNRSDDVRIVPNVADTVLFTADHSHVRHAVLTALEDIPRPRLGYVGNLASYKIDMDLVSSIAASRPDWAIVLVGPRDMGDTRRRIGNVSLPPNIHMFEAVPHDITPSIIDRFDVCLLPSAKHPVMNSSFPLKFFEYVLRERPVVGKSLPALEPFREWFYQAESPAQFVVAIENALAEGPRDGTIKRKTTELFGWNERARLLFELRGELLDG